MIAKRGTGTLLHVSIFHLLIVHRSSDLRFLSCNFYAVMIHNLLVAVSLFRTIAGLKKRKEEKDYFDNRAFCNMQTGNFLL